ncbi:MAG: outer membrane lipid asymmetry maintenance protein MlaD [Rhodospirillales bacterium]|nr:MAG: outer membrane lipid asymmetry maintenance protein MlaD [Rhodospirillales bacterium]
MGRNIVETIIGALVLCVAVGFGVYAFTANEGAKVAGYEISAKFARVDGLKRGADVQMAGIKIGTVTGMDLDTKTYDAIVRMSIRSDIKLTSDTVAMIVSESLLGGHNIRLEIGGSSQFLAAGSMILKTQPAVSLTDLLGAAVGGMTGPEKK